MHIYTNRAKSFFKHENNNLQKDKEKEEEKNQYFSLIH